MRLYIGNLSPSVTIDDLQMVLKSYKVNNCNVNQGVRKAFAIAYVEDGVRAIKDLDGSVVKGSTVKVLEAVDRKKQCVNS